MLSLLSLAALPLLASAQYGDYPTASSSTPVAAAMASMSPTSMAIPAVQTVIVGQYFFLVLNLFKSLQ